MLSVMTKLVAFLATPDGRNSKNQWLPVIADALVSFFSQAKRLLMPCAILERSIFGRVAL
jgi:hypothetical protein